MKKKKGFLLLALVLALVLFGGCATTKEINQEKDAGIEAMNKGDYDSAIKHFDKSIKMAGGKINNQVVDTCFYKAAAQYNLGEVNKALDQYTALMAYDEKDSKACFLRGSIYLKQKNEKKALADYKEAINRNPEDYELYILIYRNLSGQGYDKKAKSYLKKALKIEGDKKENYLGRGRVYLEMKEYDKASAQLDKLGDKSDDETLALMGDVALAAGQYDKALSYYQKGLEAKHPKDQQRLLNGEVAALEYTGEFKEAKKKAEAYLKQYPGDEEMQRELVFLNTR